MWLVTFRYWLQILLLTTAYFTASACGHVTCATDSTHVVTAVGPAAGIAVAALFILGTRVWPGVWLGALLANGWYALAAMLVGDDVGKSGAEMHGWLAKMPNVPLTTAALIATGNACAAWLGARLCRHVLPQASPPFQRVQEVVAFAAAAGVSSLVAATVGTVSIAFCASRTWPWFLAHWGTWWLADVASLMTVFPCVVAYANPKPISWNGFRWAELSVLSAAMALISQAVLGGWLSESLARHLLYVPLICLVWICLRFELTEVTLATVILSGVAIFSRQAGVGPFREEASEPSLFHLQMFLNICALTGLAVAAVVAHRRASEQRLQMANQELAQIVRRRTLDLTAANAGLAQEMADRQRAEEKLRERELRYRELIEHLHVGVVVHAPDTSILVSNQLAGELLGLASAQMQGKTDSDPAWSFLREDSTPLPKDEYPVNRILATRQPMRDLVYGINRRNVGDVRWVLVNALPEFDKSDELARIVVTFLDITERRLLQQRERLRLDAALESIGDSVVITGPDGLIQYVNSAFERITGYAPFEVLGHNPRLLQSGHHDQSFYRQMWQTLADGQTWHGEFVDKRKDGGLYDSDATISLIRDTAGEAIGYVGVQRDVSERKRAERQLAESEAHIRAIVDTAVDGIITFDECGTIETCNPAVESLFGYQRDELTGRRLSLLIAFPEQGECHAFLNTLAQLTQLKIPGTVQEVFGRHKDGTDFPLDLSVSKTQLGGHSFFTGILRDATIRHLQLQTARDLAAAHEQLRLARSIQRSFFPSTSPAVPGYDLAGASFAADETSGDYFDYFHMSGGNVGVVVADVCGHGLGPALVMSQTRAYLQALLPLGLDVSELTSRLNNFLITDGPDARFVTFFLAQIDPRDGRFTYASAGHECYLLGPGLQVQHLKSTGMPLGILPGRVPSARPLMLEHGQIVLFLTDGIAETLSPNDVPFGIEQTLETVRANQHLPAADIVQVLYRSARDHARNAPQQDDITAVILKVLMRPRSNGLDGADI